MSEIINYVDSLVIQHSIKSFLHYQEQENKSPNLLDIIDYVEKDTLHNGLDIIRHVNQLVITLKIKKVKADFNNRTYKLIEKL
tara:strand:- start:138 stop:386 length:249 start_codon:yes stop_codon:yes gene_type:complete